MARPAVDTLNYKEASTELDGILRALESDRLDVDSLAAAAERAAALVERCRQVLIATKERLDEVLPSQEA